MADLQIKKLTLTSSYNEIQRVEDFVKELQEWAEFDDELFGNIMLTLSEAVTNAIVHGNKEDENKNVYVEATLENNAISISIKDEGEGFDPTAIPDPRKEENLLKEAGRGVYLIDQFADEFSYSENGTKIHLKFFLKKD